MSLHAADNLICPCCGKSFHRKASWIKRYKAEHGLFCSRECAKMGHRLQMTGSGNHQFGLKGDKNASFKGMVTHPKNNSLIEDMVYLPEHPRADKSGRVREYYIIIEDNHKSFDDRYFNIINDKYYLKDSYIVHHKDFNHNNNKISNLQILTRSEHTRLHNITNPRPRNKETGRFI